MASAGALSGINTDQFLQLLIAQLQNQDPLDPVSDRDFINQLATLNTVQGIQSLNANFAEMLKLQQLTQGASLIGKTVTFAPAGGGDPRTGTVSALAVQDGAFVLNVGSDRVALSQVQNVTG